MEGLRWLFGYIVVRVPRRGTAFFREASRRGLALYGLSWKGRSLRATVLLSDVRELRRVVRAAGARAQIVGGWGLPFVWRRVRAHRLLMTVLAASLLAWAALGETIQAVDIRGGGPSVRREVLATLRTAGVERWRPVALVDVERAVRDLKSLRGVLWAEITFDGSHAVVRLEMAPKATPSPSPPASRMVAAAKGIVRRVVVTQGIALVKRGDAVLPGQVLITGYEGPPPSAVSPMAPTPRAALGEVDAVVEHTLTLTLPIVKTSLVAAGPAFWSLRVSLPNRPPITFRSGRAGPLTRNLWQKAASYRGFGVSLARSESLTRVKEVRSIGELVARGRSLARIRLEARSPKVAKWLGWREGYKLQGTILVYTLTGTAEEDIARPVGRRSSGSPD